MTFSSQNKGPVSSFPSALWWPLLQHFLKVLILKLKYRLITRVSHHLLKEFLFAFYFYFVFFEA